MLSRAWHTVGAGANASYTVCGDPEVLGLLGLRVTVPVSRTFAPLWEVFRVSSDKLALCHLELTRKLQDLIKDVLRYSEEQLKMHKKVGAWGALPGGVGGGPRRLKGAQAF